MTIHVDSSLDIADLPRECIDDCSRPGPADDAVAYWRRKLEFTVDRAAAFRCLKGYGGWGCGELLAMADETIAEKILWLAAGDFHEQLAWEAANPDRAPEDSDYGCSVFCLE